jgi:hypothetical protein
MGIDGKGRKKKHRIGKYRKKMRGSKTPKGKHRKENVDGKNNVRENIERE